MIFVKVFTVATHKTTHIHKNTHTERDTSTSFNNSQGKRASIEMLFIYLIFF